MKRAFVTILLLGIALFSIFPTTGFAAPPASPETDVEENFAPGSIVQFNHLNIEDGLYQNAGLAIFQDSRGYLWIGTNTRSLPKWISSLRN